MYVIVAVLSITALFVVFLSVKSLTDLEICAICASVSGTWVPLLVLYHGGYYGNETVIALLIGQSVVGVFYLLKGNLPDRYNVYSLPFLLTGTVFGYLLLEPELLEYSIGAVVALWTVASLLFVYREDDRVRTVFDEIVACCRDW